ncbi:MAG: glycosyltransferase [Pseudonocardiaceae bacterium]
MSPTVALVAVGAHGVTAVGSRIGVFAQGLTRRGWHVTVIDPPLPHVTLIERLLGHTPTALRSMLHHAGVEGDVQPVAGWRVRRALRGVDADVVVVSVPPFSLLGAATMTRDPPVPLILDYRDPWSARHTPPLLARVTRTIERYAVRRASAVVYAGAPAFGDLLIRRLRLPPNRVIWVPNGFDTADIDGMSGAQVRPERNDQPLRLVMNGYWYGRNGPGILSDALRRVGPAVARLTVIGRVSPPIATQLTLATGYPLVPVTTRPRRELYERLEQADAAVVTIDYTSAVESRIPAKVYDYLATGVPVIAVCPPGAALLQIPEAGRFHHVHHRDLNGLVTLLRQAMRDRATLHTGRLGEGLTREPGIETLHTTLQRLLPD